MTDFERELRERLRDAARDAPRFQGVRGGARRRAGRLHRALLAAAAAVVIAGGGATWWAAQRESSGGGHGTGSCAAVVEFGGHSYHGTGEVLRTPRHGPSIGTATFPGCADTGDEAPDDTHARAYRIDGASPKTAIFANGDVWIRKGVDHIPDPVREILQPVACTGTSTIHGTMTGEVVKGGALMEGSHEVELPYTARFEADRGSALPLRRYSEVTITLRVTARTKGGADVALARAALWKSAPVTVDVTCDGAHFVATALHRG